MNDDESEKMVESIALGDEARTLLNNPIFKNAFAQYRGQLFAIFTQSEAEEVENREIIYRQMKALDSVEDNLISLVETGKIASNILTNKNEVI